MRLALTLVLLLLLLSDSACTRTESFTAKIDGVDLAEKRGGFVLNRLKLNSQTGGGQLWSLEFSTDEHTGAQGLAPVRFGDLHLDPLAGTDYWTVTRITAGERTLSPSDLRIGHHIRVSHGQLEIGKVNQASLNILNYSPPSKALRLSISVDSSTLTKPRPSDILELIAISHLSWRLPPDVGIFRPAELPPSSSVVGDLSVRYKVATVDSGYVIRSTSTVEDVEVDVKLADSKLSTNWTNLKFRGGTRPQGTQMHDYSYQSALGQVPRFEVR